MVGDFLRAQHNLVLEAVDFAVELVCRVGTERQRGSGGEHHPVGANQVQHAVLQHLGVGGQPSEWTVFEARHHSIGHVADPGHWIGSNSGGSLPWRTSWSRNSRIWPAIAFDVASGAAKVVLRSGALASTTAITFSGSQRNVVSPIL